jgi:hypothetical protein
MKSLVLLFRNMSSFVLLLPNLRELLIAGLQFAIYKFEPLLEFSNLGLKLARLNGRFILPSLQVADL